MAMIHGVACHETAYRSILVEGICFRIFPEVTRGDLLKECLREALARRKNHAEPRVEVLALQSPGPENTPSGSPDPQTNLREQTGKNVRDMVDTPMLEGEQV